MKLVYNGHRLEVDLNFESDCDEYLIDSIILCHGTKWKEVMHRLSEATVKAIAERAWDIYTDDQNEQREIGNYFDYQDRYERYV